MVRRGSWVQVPLRALRTAGTAGRGSQGGSSDEDHGQAFTRTSGGLPFIVDSLRKGKRGWFVQGFNDSGDPSDFTVVANCIKKEKAPKLEASSASGALAGPVENQSAACPSGRKAYSGGFDGTLEPPAINVAAAVGSIRKGSGRWVTQVYTSGGLPFKTLVYCA